MLIRGALVASYAGALVAPRARRAARLGARQFVDELLSDEAWDVGADAFEAALEARRFARATPPPPENPLILVAPFAIVALFLLVLTVVTVPVDDAVAPPTRALPLLGDYLGAEDDILAASARAPRGGASSSSPPGGRPVVLELSAVVTPLDFFRATLFQWRVFSLESRYPTGFLARSSDNAVIELLRAVANFPQALENARGYELDGGREVADPDASATVPPTATLGPRLDCADATASWVVKKCAEFVDGVGVSLVARAAGDGATLGLVSLRVRRLPPIRGADADADADTTTVAPPPVDSSDDDDDSSAADVVVEPVVEEGGLAAALRGELRPVAYVTGLAVSRSARRRGVATTLLDFCERKARAWGCDGVCLHVNKLNSAALRFYHAQGFQIIPDWIGYNPMRFLLYKPPSSPM